MKFFQSRPCIARAARSPMPIAECMTALYEKTYEREERRAMKNSKRILSVTIERMVDESPDTSYMGEYSTRATSQFSIDRAHNEDCASLFPLPQSAVDTLDHASEYINSLRVDDQLDTPDDEELSAAMGVIQDLISEYSEPGCDCHGEDMGRGEYRYFNPSPNYVTKDDKPQSGITAEDVRKYVRQDYERLERLNTGDWCYFCIRAEAKYVFANGKGEGVIQTINSGGLWGIESDSDEEYFADVESEELARLRSELSAIGFSKRAIAIAFKSIKHVET